MCRFSNLDTMNQIQNDSSVAHPDTESIAFGAVQHNIIQMISNGDDTDNDMNNNHDTNQPISHNAEPNEVELAYLAMREVAEQCYLLLDQQRQALKGYQELAEDHQELQQQFAAINLENQMWRLDLERERWMHSRSISNMKIMTKSDTCFDRSRSNICKFVNFTRKQCFARAS